MSVGYRYLSVILKLDTYFYHHIRGNSEERNESFSIR